jgi:probable F420-dependent oxidoreductase
VPPVTPTSLSDVAAAFRPFRFGLQSYAATSGADWRQQARTAEALGYSAFHLADHVIGPGPALSATNHPVQTVAAVPAMAVAAEATSTIRIGCRVFCMDYRNPVMLAKEAATLDLFSDGRLELGLGAGWLQGEYEAMGAQWDSAGVRLDRFEETIGLIRAAFGEGELNIDGIHVHAVGFEAVPKPVATGSRRDGRTRPPIMIGGGARRVLGIAGREADIVSLNFDNSSGKLGPTGIGSSTAQLTAEKLRWIKAGAGDRFGEIEIEIGAYFTAVTDDRAAGLARFGTAMGLSLEEAAEHPHALIGSVDSICDTLIERRERYGISYITVGKANLEAFAPVVERLSGT